MDINDKKIIFADKMKEIHRIQYDYYKYFTTLSSSGIVLAFAFIKRIAAQLLCWQKALLFISLIFFILVIYFSLQAMKTAGNSIQDWTAFQLITNSDEASDYELKFSKSQDKISLYDKLTEGFFMAAVILILVIIAFNMFSK
jgi:hypothetical protein